MAYGYVVAVVVVAVVVVVVIIDIVVDVVVVEEETPKVEILAIVIDSLISLFQSRYFG